MERVECWQGLKRDYWSARMLATRDADQRHPLRNEEGIEIFDYLRWSEEQQTAVK